MTIFREMRFADFDKTIALWQGIEGLALSDADSRDAIERYLLRNPGLSFVCEAEGTVVGTILCGHDGRRGYIYHVAVDPAFRNRKLGQRLVELSLGKLREEGIDKCHLFVIEDNAVGNRFWVSAGWEKRSGFYVYSRNLG